MTRIKTELEIEIEKLRIKSVERGYSGEMACIYQKAIDDVISLLIYKSFFYHKQKIND